MVEVARLESVYRFIAYQGFESPSLRQNIKARHAGFFYFLLSLCMAIDICMRGLQALYDAFVRRWI